MMPALASQFHPLKLPLPEDRVKRWHPHHLFAGATTNISHMSAHVSVLSPGHSPHPPHTHREEEILVVLDGEAELLIALNETGLNARCEQLRAGSVRTSGRRVERNGVLYFPAGEMHDMKNPGSATARYLVFEFHGSLSGELTSWRSATRTQSLWRTSRNRIYRRLRQSLAATFLWHALRPIYRRLRRIFAALI